MNISGKVFVVTGAASGIGKEITLALLAKGAKVAAVDLKKESLAELSKELGENSKNISTHALSVADKKAVEALPGEVITKLGQHVRKCYKIVVCLNEAVHIIEQTFVKYVITIKKLIWKKNN